MNNILIKWVLGLSFGVLMFSCSSSYTIYADYDSAVDFSNYRTYNYLPSSDSIAKPGTQRILSYTEEYLQLLGYTKSENPDLYISVNGQVMQKTGVTSNGYGGFYGYYGWDTYTTTYVYNTTTIVVDLVDAKKRQLVWQGAANGEFDQYSIPDKKLHDLIDQIFGQYPYTAGSNQKRPLLYGKYYKKPGN